MDRSFPLGRYSLSHPVWPWRDDHPRCLLIHDPREANHLPFEKQKSSQGKGLGGSHSEEGATERIICCSSYPSSSQDLTIEFYEKISNILTRKVFFVLSQPEMVGALATRTLAHTFGKKMLRPQPRLCHKEAAYYQSLRSAYYMPGSELGTRVRREQGMLYFRGAK